MTDSRSTAERGRGEEGSRRVHTVGTMTTAKCEHFRGEGAAAAAAGSTLSLSAVGI